MAGKTYYPYGESNSMAGPYLLDGSTTSQLDGNWFGAYVLTVTGNPSPKIVVYVGRGNLKDRLTQHAADKRGEHFYYKLLATDEQAFQEECRLFRKYGKQDHLDNENKPALPPGSQLPPCD